MPKARKYETEEARKKGQLDSVNRYREQRDENNQRVLDQDGKPILKIKRVPLDMPIADYESLRIFATAHGETVNGFIKQAIKDRMQALSD